MSSDGNFFENIAPKVESFSGGGNFFENLFNDVVNYTVQTHTAGIFGYEDGKIGNGVNTNLHREMGRGLREGVKEITGANAAEEANRLAREQFEKAQADANQARLDQQRQLANDQINASRAAGAARGTNRSVAGGRILGGSSLGVEETDFLGL